MTGSNRALAARAIGFVHFVAAGFAASAADRPLVAALGFVGFSLAGWLWLVVANQERRLP